MKKRNMTLLTAIAAATAFAPTAQAAIVSITSVTATTTGTDGAGNPGGGTPQTKILNTITVGATTYNTSSLVTGTSSGAVGSNPGELVTNMDNFDVNLAASPTGTFTTSFAGNLVGAQFFIFEVGGNDPLSVKAIFAGGGGTGNSLTLSTSGGGAPWGNTGVSATDGYRKGVIYGLTFNYTDLLKNGGGNLTNEVITGLEFTTSGTGADPVSISASLVPEPSAALLLGVAGMTLLVRRRRA